MPEQFAPRFAELFLGTCRRLLDALDRPAVDANTRGDGVFVVFDQPREAAEFALRLGTAMREVDWRGLGLPPDTSARIGLHTGPVFRTWDPVMGKPTFYGTHVNRAARLEPVVSPGHVFATDAFAASLLATTSDDRLRCHYLGAMPLAKAFGEARLYRVVDRDA
jgi:class 3 adenylate cyclase